MKLEMEKEMNQLADLIRHESLKFQSSYIREQRRLAYEEKFKDN